MFIAMIWKWRLTLMENNEESLNKRLKRECRNREGGRDKQFELYIKKKTSSKREQRRIFGEAIWRRNKRGERRDNGKEKREKTGDIHWYTSNMEIYFEGRKMRNILMRLVILQYMSRYIYILTIACCGIDSWRNDICTFQNRRKYRERHRDL